MLSGATAAWIALVVAGPMALAAALWDLRRMRIPNALNIALAAGWLPLGLATLPLDAVGLRIAGALLVLVAGFAVFAIGKVGAGDVKMLAAGALWVPGGAAPAALLLLSAALLIGAAAVFAARRILASPDHPWRGLRPQAKFPMGVSIGGALIAFLGLAVRAAS
ncbi:MAG: prepilin peptidase [Pseudomonadota bacterium]